MRSDHQSNSQNAADRVVFEPRDLLLQSEMCVHAPLPAAEPKFVKLNPDVMNEKDLQELLDRESWNISALADSASAAPLAEPVYLPHSPNLAYSK